MVCSADSQIGDLPTRFKYTQSAPVDFGLSPVEILLATDAELNALAAMKHLAPYKRGTGMGRASQGLNKRIRDLKRTLQARRWGEEAGPEEEEPKEKGSGSNAGPTGGVKRKWGAEEKGDEGGAHGDQRPAKKSTGPGGAQKRLGKKQRMRAKLAAEAEAAEKGEQLSMPSTSAPTSKPVRGLVEGEGGETGGEGKKKRRKKKKSGVANGNGEVEG